MALVPKTFLSSVCFVVALIAQCCGQGMFDVDPMMAPLLFGGNLLASPGSQSQSGNTLFASGSLDTSATINFDTSSNVPDLNNTVTYIIGPEASPDDGLRQYAAQNGWPPQSDLYMINYIPHFQRIARTTFASHLAKIALETVKSAENQRNASLTSQLNPAEKANSVQAAVAEMKALTEELNSLVMQKSMEWADLHLKVQATANTTPSSNIGGFDWMPLAFMGGFK